MAHHGNSRIYTALCIFFAKILHKFVAIAPQSRIFSEKIFLQKNVNPEIFGVVRVTYLKNEKNLRKQNFAKHKIIKLM